MDFDYEKETLVRALEGDHEAGREALDLCMVGLWSRRLSPALSDYLAGRISAYLAGEPLARALCVEDERGPGRPRDPIRAWQIELAAFDLLLERRGYAIEQRNAAMDVARARTNPKGLGIDRFDASRLRKSHSPMRSIKDDRLLDMAGQALREILMTFNPQSPGG